MTMDEFDASLRAHTADAALIATCRAAVLRSVGDHYYWQDDPRPAAEYYARALRIDRSHLPTWAKRGFLATGAVGRTLRTAAASLRSRVA